MHSLLFWLLFGLCVWAIVSLLVGPPIGRFLGFNDLERDYEEGDEVPHAD